MRTRLRSHRRHEDDLPQSVRAPEPVSSTAPPQNGLQTLQRTIGNAAMRRYLHPEQSSTTAGLISRNSAKEKAEQNPALVPGRRPVAYMTVMDDKGKTIPGLSKRKGREGQFELLHFRVGQTGIDPGSASRRSDVTRQKVAREGNQTTIKTNDRVAFTFSKRMDATTPILGQLVAEGRKVILRVEVVVPEADGKETVLMTVDMPHVFMGGQQTGGSDADPSQAPLETYIAETEGMTTVLNAMADKVKQSEAKKPAVEEPGPK